MLKKLLPLSVLLFAQIAPAPPAAPTIGFFLDSWQPKSFQVPPYQETRATAAVKPAVGSGTASAVGSTASTAAVSTATVTLRPDSTITRIPLSIFGHNAVTWMGPMVTQPELMTNLTNLNAHILRWPAGSGSDMYFWNCAPGEMPSDVPWMMPDANGKKKAARFFLGRPSGRTIASVDDYYALLARTGDQGLITVNYGYARYGTSANPVATAAHLAANWVRYDHGRTHYWELGNENYGFWEAGFWIDTIANKDGQPKVINGGLYAKHFQVFADSMRRAAAEVGATIYIGAIIHDAPAAPWEPATTKHWNADLMKNIHDDADFYVVHSYFTPYMENSTAAQILRDADTVPRHTMDYVLQCLHENGAAVKPIAMDEWNMFAAGSRQQVSNVSGLFGVIVLGESLKSKYGLDARWDLSNGWDKGNDHGLFSAGDEPGVKRWSPRPSFYYLYYLQRMIGDRLIASNVSGDTSLRVYGSAFSSGELGAALVNTAASPVTVTLDTRHVKPGRRYYWYSLQGGDDNGDFSGKVFVNGHGPSGPAGGPSDYATIKANAAPSAPAIRVTVPARGAVFLVIAKS